MSEKWSPQQPLKEVLKKGALYRQFENMKSARRIIAVIGPICERLRLGVALAPNMCRVEIKRTRIKDEDPYGLGADEEPFNRYREEVRANILLPSVAMVTKFNQLLPTLHNALGSRGLGAVKLVAYVENFTQSPAPFLHTDLYPKIHGKEAKEGAQALAERLPQDSPLKKEMALLAQSLSKD